MQHQLLRREVMLPEATGSDTPFLVVRPSRIDRWAGHSCPAATRGKSAPPTGSTELWGNTSVLRFPPVRDCGYNRLLIMVIPLRSRFSLVDYCHKEPIVMRSKM